MAVTIDMVTTIGTTEVTAASTVPATGSDSGWHPLQRCD